MTTAQNTERTGQPSGSGREIEAQLHGHPASRVSRLFDASLRHAIDEVLQNARRAGATLVDIETSEDGSIRITDNGRGIADPEVLLAFGESDWDTATSQQEHTHGSGLFALARWNPTIRSRPAGRPDKAWRVSLTEDHFRGAAKATVRSDNEGAPEPHGTEVTIREADGGGTKASAMRTRTTNERIETAAPPLPGQGPTQRRGRGEGRLPGPLRMDAQRGRAMVRSRHRDLAAGVLRRDELPRQARRLRRTPARERHRRTGVERAGRRARGPGPGADAPAREHGRRKRVRDTDAGRGRTRNLPGHRPGRPAREPEQPQAGSDGRREYPGTGPQARGMAAGTDRADRGRTAASQRRSTRAA